MPEAEREEESAEVEAETPSSSAPSGVAADSRVVGVGPLPAEFVRFDWAVFILPGLWGIVYGIWPLALLWLGALFLPLALASLVGPSPGTSTVIGLSILADAVSAIVRLWSALNARRLYWHREALRLERTPGAEPLTFEKFRRRQRLWLFWGIGIGAGATLAGLPIVWLSWRDYGLSWAGVIETVLWTAAVIGAAAWLARRTSHADVRDTG